MATTSDRRTAGGKIMRNRRIPASSRTPYSRPEKLPENVPNEEEQPGNPNWLSGLIYPAKMIASGAGKIISFFGADASSSDDDYEDEDDVIYENDDDEEDVENDVSPSQGHGQSNKELSSFSKSDKKRTIEQLVMQETFSREEGNELIKLIKSRMVDTNGNFDESAAKLRTTALVEAKKWLQQKRSGSKKKMEYELDVTNLATPSHVSKGSPVDMAKSYMQNRSAWAFPSLKHTEFGSPPPLGILSFKEETPKSILRSSEMKKNSLSSGSWNLLEEIRRVRSKATEELLAATPLTKTVLSSITPEKDRPQSALLNHREANGAESTDRPEYIPSDVSTGHPTRVNQCGDAVQSMEHQECQEATDLTKDDELNELRGTSTENGFPSTTSGLDAGEDATQKARSLEEQNGNVVGLSQADADVHMEETLSVHQEPACDVQNPDPTDNVVNGSQNSSSMQQEELSQEHSQPIAEQTSKSKAGEAPPKERKSRGYTRRGRGRGK